MGKLSHELERESLKLVLLDQLVQVDAEQLECDAHVAPEHEVIKHVDQVERVILVLLPQVLQDPDFLLSLPVKPFLVPDHFESDVLVGLVIVGLDHLAEASLAYHLEHLVPVGQVIVRYVRVGALVVVVTAVVWSANDARPLLGVGADEVDLGVVEYLMMLVRRQLVHVQLHDLLRRGHHRLRLETSGAATAVGAVVVGPRVD